MEADNLKTTIGIPILVILLRILTFAFAQTPLGSPPESIQSGNYGRPPKARWWLKQSFIYFLGLLGMKLCVFLIFELCPWIIQVGDWALRWTEGNETVQVFFVMLFFPVVMNAIQYYIIDSFIKDQKPSDHQPLSSEDQDSDDEDQDGHRRQTWIDEDVVDRNEEAKSTAKVEVHENKERPLSRKHPRLRTENGPAIDGESSASFDENENSESVNDDRLIRIGSS